MKGSDKVIFTIAKVTIRNQGATIDQPILLYRGDKNVEVQFLILEGDYRQYKLESGNTIENLDASYGQLVVIKPTGEALFSEVTATKEGRIVFTIPQELIDEETECGYYTFQIRLFDESQGSRVSLPPVYDGIEVREPIAHEN